jgi:hypothetical protein
LTIRGSTGVEVQACGERCAEIMPGRANAQQGLAATCTDHWIEVWSTQLWWRVLVWRMSP